MTDLTHRPSPSRLGTVLGAACTIVCVGCGGGGGRGAAGATAAIKVDGSSTVAPILFAAADLFAEEHPAIQVQVGVSGTGGGFKKFLEDQPDLRTDLSNASRPIQSQERERARSLGVEYIELPIALDGIAIVVNPRNAFCSHLTIEELKRIWSPGSTIQNWKEIRPEFPDVPLKLYGPGTDSGTFDYFTEAVIGKSRSCRSDYTASENDNMLVQGVAGDRGALGYFGFAYYEAHKDIIKVLPIDGGGGDVLPDRKTIHDGVYRPLSRPLFLYVNRRAADRPEVRAFIEFLLDNAKRIVEHPKVNYVALDAELYAAAKKRFADRVGGSAFESDGSSGKSLLERYAGR